MRIADIHVHVLEASLSQAFAYSRAWYTKRTALIVEIVTDEELIGWGECYGPARINAAVVEQMRPFLVGQDPLRTCAAGGLSECKKIADMAAAFGVRYAPHVWGTGIATAAALQLLATLPAFSPPSLNRLEPLLELDRTEHPIRQALLTERIDHVRGRVAVPTNPGLGIAIDRQALRHYRVS